MKKAIQMFTFVQKKLQNFQKIVFSEGALMVKTSNAINFFFAYRVMLRWQESTVNTVCSPFLQFEAKFT